MALLGVTLSDLLGGGGGAPAATTSGSVLIGQAPTNLGPLTATFTPPPACTVAVADGSSGFLSQACDPINGAVDALSCWPPLSAGVASPSPPFHGLGFYSPGVACPSGYASACSATAGGSAGWPVQFSLQAGETAVGCCPSGYTCGNIDGQTCIQLATSTKIPTVTCQGGTSGAFGFQTVDAKASITAFSLFAPMIQINFQSSDLQQPVAATTPASSTGTAAPQGTSTSPPETASTGTLATVTTARSSSGSTGTLDTDPGAPQPTKTAGADTGTDSPAADSPSAAQTSDAASAAADSGNSGSGGSKLPMTVGIAVGGGVGAAVVAVVGIMINRRRWRERRERRDPALMKLDDMYESNKPSYFTEPDLLPGGRSQAVGDSLYRGYRP